MNKVFRWFYRLAVPSSSTNNPRCSSSSSSRPANFNSSFNLPNHSGCSSTSKTDETRQSSFSIWKRTFRRYTSHHRNRDFSQNSSVRSMSSIYSATLARQNATEERLQLAMFRFSERELLLKNRPRRSHGRCVSSDRPRICICSCLKKSTTDSVSRQQSSSESEWDASWVFKSDPKAVRKWARQCDERIREALLGCDETSSH